MRKSSGSRVFLELMFVCAAIVSLLVTFISGDFYDISWNNIPYVYGASFFYVIYQIFVSKSYKKGEMSANYPLTVLSPIFVPLWAYLFLAEKISLFVGFGIVITVCGAMLIKLKAFNKSEIKKIFSFHNDYIGARFALLASLVYSFGAIFDKSKINSFPFTAYLSFILVFMSINLIIYNIRYRRESLFKYFKINYRLIILGGLTTYLSFMFFRLALKHVMISIAIPVRLTSIIFAIILSVFVLKEKMIIGRIVGVIAIIAGIILLNLLI